MERRATCFAILFLLACSGATASPDSGTPDSGPRNAITGSVNGLSIAAKDAAATIAPRGAFAPTANIAIADVDGLCSIATMKPMSTVLELHLFDDVSQGTVTIGTYRGYNDYASSALAGSKSFIVGFSNRAGMCALEATYGASHGEIIVEAITSSEISGTVELTFEQGHLGGRFTASICASGTAIVTSKECAP